MFQRLFSISAATSLWYSWIRLRAIKNTWDGLQRYPIKSASQKKTLASCNTKWCIQFAKLAKKNQVCFILICIAFSRWLSDNYSLLIDCSRSERPLLTAALSHEECCSQVISSYCGKLPQYGIQSITSSTEYTTGKEGTMQCIKICSDQIISQSIYLLYVYREWLHT